MLFKKFNYRLPSFTVKPLPTVMKRTENMHCLAVLYFSWRGWEGSISFLDCIHKIRITLQALRAFKRYAVEYNSAEVVFHYLLSSILLFYLNIHPKLTQHKDTCLKKMLQTLKLLVFDLVFKVYVV